MIKTDFIKYDIIDFSPEEIENTGAELQDVQLITIYKLQKFRLLENRPISLLPGGLTTGNHKSPEHYRGKAVDIAIPGNQENVNVSQVFKNALQAGFKGFGVYHNGTAYSFHLHIGKKFAFWLGYKKHREKDWKYKSLIIDPKEFTK